MGTLQGTSDANLIVHQRQSFEKELGIPGLGEDDRAPSDPNRIWVGSNNNIFYTGQDGEPREVVPFDPSVLDNLFPAIYEAPTAQLTSGTPATGEVGQYVNIQLEIAFNKKDAGDPVGYRIDKNGQPLAPASTFTDPNVLLSASPVSYRGEVSYAQGPIKLNQLGNLSDLGRIPAGEVMTNTLSFRGYYFVGYGSVSSEPTTSAAVRSLSSRLSNNTAKFNLTASTTMQAIVIPPDMELVSVIDLDAVNADLTSQYQFKSLMAVNNAAGAPVSNYKRYIRTQGVAYTAPHRHEVTLRRI